MELSVIAKKKQVIHQIYFYQYLKFGATPSRITPKPLPASWYYLYFIHLKYGDLFSPAQYIALFESSFRKLSRIERHVIIKRYFSNSSNYEYRTSCDIAISVRSYYRIKRGALMKLYCNLNQ